MALFDIFRNKNKERKPFASTNLGIAFNTVTGLPKATKDVTTDILRGITRNIASAGVTIGNSLGGEDKIAPGDIHSNLGKFFYKRAFGDEPIESIQNRIVKTEKDLIGTPLEKQSKSLAFLGVMGSVGLDLTPFGGLSKNVGKQLLKTTSRRQAGKILKSLKVPEEAIPQYARIFAKAKTKKQVDTGLNMMTQSLGIKKLSDLETSDIKAIDKLITAVRGSKPERRALEEAFRAERASRASKIERIFERGEGEKGFQRGLAQLKGELSPDKKLESRIKIDQKDIDSLINKVQMNPTMDVYGKINTVKALDKVLKGSIPTDTEMRLLEQSLGSELIVALRENRSGLQKLQDAITESVNIPRTLMTSIDLSAPLRQGVFFIGRPKPFSKATSEMFKQALSPKNYKNWFDDLPKDPLYPKMRDSRLYIADPTKVSGGLAAKEEAFMTNLAQKIPVIGPLVKFSERGYTSFLNNLRVGVFKQMYDDLYKRGEVSPENLKAISKYINNATGRGGLGTFEQAAQSLNSVFFSPRLIASRFNLMNPVWYAKQTPYVRKQAMKDWLRFLGVGSTVLAVSSAGGADVELNPTSADFGKVKVGNTRFDVWGGFQQWVRVASQMIAGQRKSTTSGEIYPISKDEFPYEGRVDVAGRFFRGKLSPIPSLALEVIDGQTMFGEDIELEKEAVQNLVPLYLQDMGEAIREMGPGAIFVTGIPAFFGVGVQTYGGEKTQEQIREQRIKERERRIRQRQRERNRR